MAVVAARNNVLLIEPQAELDEAKGAVFLDAVHPTALGHWLIAEILAKELEEAGLVTR
jgi:phospholipase/lecithinase/hemolysin